MADAAAVAGTALRPHVKAHKCGVIAQMLRRAGAIGASCATLSEAEAMAGAGIEGLLITSPIVGRDGLDRLTRLLARGADVAVVADHPAPLAGLAAAAMAAGRILPVLVDFDVGQGRTGCVDGDAATALAQSIDDCEGLRFGGVQAYWGHLQQVAPPAERRARVLGQADRVRALVRALRDGGRAAEIVTGGGTGTAHLDFELGLFTDVQPGSYLFLDSCYAASLPGDGDLRFRPALFVSAVVVSANRPGTAIVDAGLKAFATDSGRPEPVRGAPAGASYRFMGDEHGALDFDPGAGRLVPGDRVLFLASHCDPTVNLYGHFHVLRDDRPVDRWPIVGRY
ncbi:MAG: alanine racemase [Geminicoccaceae bacterium]|nr:alanine racemase [Geminicoccaceae bacterium]